MGLVLAFALASKTVYFTVPKSLFGILWPGFLLSFALMVYAAFEAKKKRRAALERFGMEMGFVFFERPDEALAARLAQIQFTALRKNSSAKYRNVLVGRAAGIEAVIADQTERADDSQSTSTIVAFNFGATLPRFALFPESPIWRVLEKVGYSDIRLENAAEFSKRFFLHGENEVAVRELFKPEITLAFLALDPKIHLLVSASGPWLAFYRPSGLIRVEHLREFLQQSEPIASAFRKARSSSVFG
jgi:hypothetical protein